jgi:hypothetical protein
VNRWQNIAVSLPLRLCLYPLLNMKHAKSSTPSKKLHRAQPAICRPPLQVAAVFLAGFLAGCLDGCWPMAVPKQNQHRQEKLLALWRKQPPQAAQFQSLHRN